MLRLVVEGVGFEEREKPSVGRMKELMGFLWRG